MRLVQGVTLGAQAFNYTRSFNGVEINESKFMRQETLG